MARTNYIKDAELQIQRDFTARIVQFNAGITTADGRTPLAYTKTFGCQQNENDTERINGMLEQMGYGFTNTPEEADLILFNTCAIRDHAEQKVYGTVGSLASLKRAHPNVVIALCGCMVQQPEAAEEIRKKYRHVNLLFGPHALYRFPENLWKVLHDKNRVFDNAPSDGNIAEGLPVRRADKTRAWVSIMSGCNNFCSYCIVPHVRGRERSRKKEDILAEVSCLIKQGYKEITLLGQNVNSYGKDLYEDFDFSDLLREIDGIEGEYILRFMTSHPKDASEKLIRTIAQSRHVSHHIHLPFQSGSNRILRLMNRRYTREAYLDLVRFAKDQIPDAVFTSDVIVGFPTETEDDFQETVSLIREVGFDGLFTFIYSPRNGTPAATMEGQISDAEKHDRYDRLSALQAELSAQSNQKLVGTVLEVLVTGQNEKDPSMTDGRTDANKLVHFQGSYPVGSKVTVRIDRALHWGMYGTAVEV